MQDFENEGALAILVAKQLGVLGRACPPSGVWSEAPEAFTIWVFTSTRTANTYVITP